jgi:protein-disulfide isomerase
MMYKKVLSSLTIITTLLTSIILSTTSISAKGIDDQTYVFRFFNKINGSHLYTIDEGEKTTIQTTLTNQYTYEGIKYSVAKSALLENGVPVYRFFNKEIGSHFYTTNESEKNQVMALPKYSYEGIKFYVVLNSGTELKPIYRFFNTQNGAHLYTDSETEKNSIINNLKNFKFEGIAYYVPTDIFIGTSYLNNYLGDSASSVVMLQFSEYNSPFFENYLEGGTFDQIKTNFIDTNKIKYVFKDYPLEFHDPKYLIANAALCHYEQTTSKSGSYLELMIDIYALNKSVVKSDVRTLAISNSLNMTQFDNCVASNKYLSKIETDIFEGNTLGVAGTPAFWIGKINPDGTLQIENGELIMGAQPYSVFEVTLNKYL